MKRIFLTCLCLFAVLNTSFSQYCAKTFRDGSTVQLTNVALGTINQTSTHDADDGYEDFTSEVTPVTPGDTYTLNIDDNTSGAGHNGRLYFDWNQDFDFDDANETVTFTSTVAAYTVDFTVPASATLGNTRMRVVLAWNGGANTDACSDFSNGFQYGECEDYTLNVGGTPLPVEYAYFNVNTENDKVILNWATTTEDNNSHFVIEHSGNGIHWEALTNVNGKGYSSTTHAYTYTDSESKGTHHYYRLKQVDKDGKWHLSSVKYIYLKHQPITVYPNPFKDHLKIAFTAIDEDISKTIYLSNAVGEVVYQSNTANRENITIDVSSLNNGIYHLKIIYNDIANNYKLIKQ